MSYIDEGALYYTSSTNAKRVFWAVEKGSYGAEGGYYDSKAYLPLRCIRALPAKTSATDISSISGVLPVSTFEKHDATSERPIVLEFKDRLTASLYRPRIAEGSMRSHNEDEAANLFYEGIYVSRQPLPMKYSLGYLIGYEGTQDGVVYDGTVINPCEGYTETYNGTEYTDWRVPNLVELSAMNAAGLIKSGTACCTQFSNIGVRYGFVYENRILCPGGSGKEGQVNTSYLVRCVRDVPEGYFDSGNP